MTKTAADKYSVPLYLPDEVGVITIKQLPDEIIEPVSLSIERLRENGFR